MKIRDIDGSCRAHADAAGGGIAMPIAWGECREAIEVSLSLLRMTGYACGPARTSLS